MKYLKTTFCLLVTLGQPLLGLSHGLDHKKTALMIIDVQNCFMEASGTSSGQDGSLAVAGTAGIVPIINGIRTEKSCLFDVVVRSQDYHTVNHISFAPTHGLEPFAHLSGKGELPVTCIDPDSGSQQDASCCPTYHISPYDCNTTLCPDTENSPVEALVEIMESPACTICKETPEECFETTQAMWTNHCLQEGDSTFARELITEDSDIVLQKGLYQYVDSYSAFMDNTRRLKTPLDNIMQENNVGTIYIMGIATDYCVYYSVLDALTLGYEVYLVVDASRGIAGETTDAALADMEAKGAMLINSTDVFATECPKVEEKSTSGAVFTKIARAALLPLTILITNLL
jgi:nicotinamidase-related amidase